MGAQSKLCLARSDFREANGRRTSSLDALNLSLDPMIDTVGNRLGRPRPSSDARSHLFG